MVSIAPPRPRALKPSEIEQGWSIVAPYLLTKAMKANNMTYNDLAAKLKAIGLNQSADQLNRKVNRKRFSAAFFLICMSVMGLDSVPVPKAQTVIDRFVRPKIGP